MAYLVTGSNRGLGLELIRSGVRLGYELIAACRTESSELASLAREYPGKVHIRYMDVSDTASVEKAASEIGKEFKSINGLINNAAVLYGSKYDTGDPISAIDLAETEDTLNVNIMGVVRVMKFFIPLIYAARGDRWVINISTEGAILRDTGYHYISYSFSKCALNGYTQKIRNYLVSQPDKADIRVYMIHPGRMDTLMGKENAQIQPSRSAEGIWAIIERRVEANSSFPFFDYLGNNMLKG
jgi:NAD(P)-dependent dehydrogenase (short-subunit alcohol dehydrogenase family)